MGAHSNDHSSFLGRYSGSGGSSNSIIQEFIALLEFVSGILTAVYVLSLFVGYGSGLVAIFVVFVYLVGWEFVGTIFDEVRRKTPTPLRFLVTIIEDIFDISF